MSWLSSLIKSVASIFTPRKAPLPVPRMAIGVNVHRLLDEDVALLRQMGVKLLRISLYADGDGALLIHVALSEGFDVLVCSYRNKSDRQNDRLVWPSVTWQYGNEPFVPLYVPSVVDQAAGGEVSCGFRNDTPASDLRAYAQAADHSQIIATHIYGDVLVDAVTNRLVTVTSLNRRVWVTEIGKVGGDAYDLYDALTLLQTAGIERTYVYSLWSPDDGYTLTPAQRQAIASFNAGRV